MWPESSFFFIILLMLQWKMISASLTKKKSWLIKQSKLLSLTYLLLHFKLFMCSFMSAVAHIVKHVRLHHLTYSSGDVDSKAFCLHPGLSLLGYWPSDINLKPLMRDFYMHMYRWARRALMHLGIDSKSCLFSAGWRKHPRIHFFSFIWL